MNERKEENYPVYQISFYIYDSKSCFLRDPKLRTEMMDGYLEDD